MRFVINVPHDRKFIKLIVERISPTDRIEQYRVSGRNRSIILQTNRPIFKLRGLKHRRPGWQLIEGTLKYKSLLEAITNEIEKEIKRLDG